MDLAAVTRLLPGFAQLHTQMVLLSGGEPLLNPEWAAIAELLRRNGLKVWLLTSGLALAKHARRAAELFDAITVSLDGTDLETYAAIRGLDAFHKVCEGIQAAAAEGSPRQEDLPQLGRILDSLEQDHPEDFRSRFIAENPQKLRRILQYFAAVLGFGPYPKVSCNAPEFSAVIGATGRVQPCFFISGPLDARLAGTDARTGADLPVVLNSGSMSALRTAIRDGRRAECKTCVCSMWRDPDVVRLSAPPTMVATP